MSRAAKSSSGGQGSWRLEAISLAELPFTHLSQRDVDTLSKLASMLERNSVAVEVGSYLGASSLCIARNLRSHATRLFCIDRWNNATMSEGPRDTYAEFLQNTAKYRAQIEPVRSSSEEAARHFARQVDLLFIDGDHSFDGCLADLTSWIPKVCPDGIVAVHDFGWSDGVREAIRERLWTCQQGPGHWEGNIYWTRVNGRTSKIANGDGVVASVVLSTLRADKLPFAYLSALLDEQSEEEEICIVRTGQCTSGVSRKNNPPPLSKLHEVKEATPGLLAGRHRGVGATRGEILIFIDDDVRLPRNWLSAMLEPFGDPSVHLVGCRYLPEFSASPPTWLEQIWSTSEQGRFLPSLSLLDFGPQVQEIDPAYIWGLCYAVRRETLIKLGGFHPDAYPWELRRFRGDGETAPSVLARQLKLKAIYQGKTAIYHQIPATRLTLRYFERRAQLQGISDSYTAIRSQGKATDVQLPAKWSWKEPLRRVKQAILRRDLPMSLESCIQSRIAKAYSAGFRFHQTQVVRDPKLLEWVLQDDYWDYRLPRG